MCFSPEENRLFGEDTTYYIYNIKANPDRDAYKPLWKFLLNLLSSYELTIHIHWRIIKLTGKNRNDFNMCFFNLSQGVDMTMKFG